MNNSRLKAFSFIEVLISLSLFSFIVVMLLSIYRIQLERIDRSSSELKLETTIQRIDNTYRRLLSGISSPSSLTIKHAENAIQIGETEYFFQDQEFISRVDMKNTVALDLPDDFIVSAVRYNLNGNIFTVDLAFQANGKRGTHSYKYLI